MISERATNWTIVPCPHPAWAKLVYPELDEDAAYERLWDELWHVLRLDEADPAAAWDEPHGGAEGARRRRSPSAGFDALELRGPGTELTVGLLPTRALARRATSRPATGSATCRTCRPRRSSRRPIPSRTEGHVTSTKPLVLKDGAIVRGLRVRFEGGRAVEVDADENAGALRAKVAIDEGAAPARRGRARRPAGPDRAARHRLLRHAARRERGQPHRARLRLRASPSRSDDHDRVNTSAHPHRLHDRLARARGHRRHRRRRARAGPARRRLAGLS